MKYGEQIIHQTVHTFKCQLQNKAQNMVFQKLPSEKSGVQSYFIWFKSSWVFYSLTWPFPYYPQNIYINLVERPSNQLFGAYFHMKGSFLMYF